MKQDTRPLLLRLVAPLTLAGLIALVGCSDDPTAPANTVQLTETEAVELFDVLMAIGDMDVGFMGTQVATFASVAAFTSWEETYPCPQGGNVHQTVEITSFPNEDSGTGTASISSTETHNSCGVTVEAGQVTVDGSPNLGWDMSFDMQNWEWVGTMTASMSGTLSLSGAYSGTCTIDINYTGNPETNTFTANGSVCGTPVNESFTG